MFLHRREIPVVVQQCVAVLDTEGADDDVVAADIQRAVGTKWAGHQINQVSFVRPKRTMSQIGG